MKSPVSVIDSNGSPSARRVSSRVFDSRLGNQGEGRYPHCTFEWQRNPEEIKNGGEMSSGSCRDAGPKLDVVAVDGVIVPGFNFSL